MSTLANNVIQEKTQIWYLLMSSFAINVIKARGYHELPRIAQLEPKTTMFRLCPPFLGAQTPQNSIGRPSLGLPSPAERHCSTLQTRQLLAAAALEAAHTSPGAAKRRFRARAGPLLGLFRRTLRATISRTLFSDRPVHNAFVSRFLQHGMLCTPPTV